MPTAVITGCNSGIGNSTAKLALEDGYDVWACDMTIGDPIKALEGPKCKIVQLDVTSIESIQKFKQTLGNTPVDVLYNIAGIMIDPEKDKRHNVTLEVLQKSFAVNTFGPLLLTQALEPNILAAPAPRRIGVISSRVGSIADNSSGGYYAYRASKCAVNNFFWNLAIELKEKDVIVSILHPGFTNTNLSPDIKHIPGVVEPEVAAEALWKILKIKGIEDTGKFWHREGQNLPCGSLALDLLEEGKGLGDQLVKGQAYWATTRHHVDRVFTVE